MRCTQIIKIIELERTETLSIEFSGKKYQGLVEILLFIILSMYENSYCN